MRIQFLDSCSVTAKKEYRVTKREEEDEKSGTCNMACDREEVSFTQVGSVVLFIFPC